MEVNFPNFEKGLELDVGGILVPNGGSVKLTDDQEQGFVSRHGRTPKDWAGESENVKVKGSGKISTNDAEKMFPATEPPSAPNPYTEEGQKELEAEENATDEGGEG